MPTTPKFSPIILNLILLMRIHILIFILIITCLYTNLCENNSTMRRYVPIFVSEIIVCISM